MHKYPRIGPREAFCRRKQSDIKSEDYQKELKEELRVIVNSVDGQNIKQPGVLDKIRASQLDCSLYAQDDKYA